MKVKLFINELDEIVGNKNFVHKLRTFFIACSSSKILNLINSAC